MCVKLYSDYSTTGNSRIYFIYTICKYIPMPRGKHHRFVIGLDFVEIL